MRFRYIDIPKLVLQLLRPNYSVRRDHSYTEQPFWTPILYRWCCMTICTTTTWFDPSGT